MGFVLVNELERRLGEPTAPRYRLSADIALAEDGIGITADQEITRFRLRGRVDWELIDAATGEPLTSGANAELHQLLGHRHHRRHPRGQARRRGAAHDHPR